MEFTRDGYHLSDSMLETRRRRNAAPLADRILTTHTGSLPRPEQLVTALAGRDQQAISGGPAFETVVAAAVVETVRRQTAIGIDVINDGEMGKVGYATYVTARLSGFNGQNPVARGNVEQSLFPEYYQWRPLTTVGLSRPLCTNAVAWHGSEQVRADIERLQTALAGAGVAEGFMSAASPGVIWAISWTTPTTQKATKTTFSRWQPAMSHEYRQIIGAGLLLQIDCPDLGSGWGRPMFEQVGRRLPRRRRDARRSAQ